MTYKKFIILVLLTIASFSGQLFSQDTSWSDWSLLSTIEDDSLLIRYYIPEESTCENGNEYNKFQLKISGIENTEINSIQWKLGIKNCYDEDAILKVTIDLADKKLFYPEGECYFSKEFDFEANSLDESHFDVKTSYYDAKTSIEQVLKYSKKAFSIEGPKRVFITETAEYRVDGGALGLGADWFWYIDSCKGTPIAIGTKMNLRPEKPLTLYLKAEGTYNTTECIIKKIEYDEGSKDPVAIEGNNKLCAGERTILTVKGGILGTGANWKWFENDCNNGTYIGTGESVSVNPEKSTTYYVRAEGRLNITNCAAIDVTVFNRSIKPDSIILSKNEICSGENVLLRVVGGNLSNEANWVWLNNSCSGKPIGNGPVLNFQPDKSVRIFVKADGVCIEYNECQSGFIKVTGETPVLDRVIKRDTIYLNEEVKIKIPGDIDTLENKAYWYKDACKVGIPLGTGSSLSLKLKQETNMYVLLKNKCFTSECFNFSLVPDRSRKKSIFRPNSFTHFQFSLGPEYNLIIQDATIVKSNKTFFEEYNLSGLGINGGFQFHPILKEYFGLGLGVNGGIGKSSLQLLNNLRNYDRYSLEEKFDYQRLGVSIENAIGFKSLKLLGIINKTIQTNKYLAASEPGINFPISITVDNTFSFQKTSLGLRIGSYAGGKGLDIMYTFFHETSAKLFALDYSAIKNEIQGISITYWNFNSLNVKFDYSLAGTLQKWNEASLKNGFWSLQINYQLDRFY
jgi:hypothetical protein